MAVCDLNFLKNYSTKPSEAEHALDTILAFASTKVVDLTDAFLNGLQNTTVENFKKFSENNNKYMKRLMEINLMQRLNIISNVGIDAHQNGVADKIIPTAQKPSYVEGNNYLDFVQNVQAKELIGENTTRVNNRSINGEPRNLYPDELDAFSRGQGVHNIWSWTENKPEGYTSTSESSFDVWNVDCDQNSILAKTKRLFKEKKINTIISRFGTGADYVSPVKYNGQIATQYGESRGRNLLTKDAESWKNNGNVYNINGYKNPYCRVWTHHHKYDSLYKTMRPFSSTYNDDGRGSYSRTKNLNDVNTWTNGFEKGYDMNYKPSFNDKGEEQGTRPKWGWRSADNVSYDKSVMSDGLINFAPMFDEDGQKKIHTRDCMFSIENLAWKDFSPYDFETALSWEQRGPNGGRIMWFPPYGLTFNETTQAQWQSHQFIGRGEDVYTYTNTVRSGNLSFLLVVDHPSIIDYVFGIHNSNNNISDNDVHRYFAGCNMDTLRDAAKPTPLTDEYRKSLIYDVAQEVYEGNGGGGKVPEIKAPEQITEITISCYFPTNYSGHFDSKKWDEGDLTDGKGYAWLYMLIGNYSSFYYNDNGNLKTTNYVDMYDTYFKDILYSDDIRYLKGYKMGNSWETGNSDEYICRHYKNKKSKIIKDCNYKRYYRVDTNLTQGEIKDYNIDTINQTNSGKNGESYDPDHDNKWNLEGKNDVENNYSFFDFCWAILNVYYYDDKHENLINFLQKKYNSRIDSKSKKLVELFQKLQTKNLQIEKVNIGGYSDISNKKKPDTKNENLAKFRADFFKELITNSGACKDEVIQTEHHSSSKANGEDRAPNRCAIMKIFFKTVDTTTAPKGSDQIRPINNTNNNNDNKIIKSRSYIGDYTIEYTDTGKKTGDVSILGKNNHNYTLYQSSAKNEVNTNTSDKKDNSYKGTYKSSKDYYYWININEGENDATPKMILYHDDFINGNQGEDGYEIKSRKDEKNTLRYDQEYYFFKKLEAKDNITFKKLVTKLQYFDPAFHSMTPEGFNGRLTFLNQCMRQGDTLVAIENKIPDATKDDKRYNQRSTANNLAFGRPPFCVLRIGDFYNQMIIIESLNINYDFDGGVKWDLNSEGIGVQPLLAQVNLGIKFIGGGDITGPIRRLQNAMSFNYYANTRFYDNRADRLEYNINEKTGKQEINKKASYMHKVNRGNGELIDIQHIKDDRVVKRFFTLNDINQEELNNNISNGINPNKNNA